MQRPAIAFLLMSLMLVNAPARGAGPIVSGGSYEVDVVPDIAYREGPDADARKQKLDLYLPRGKTGFPVLVFIHGGAWSSGDRKLYIPMGMTFARNGIGTVVLSYRLTPKVQHPGHIEDVARALAWTNRNIARHGGRPDQIFVTGQSAGGHLAALLATNDAYLKAEGLDIKSIKGVIPISGVYLFPPGRLTRIIGDSPEAREDASPLGHVTGKEPPFLILYAQNDFPSCDRMSLALDAALKEKHVESSYREIKDRNHISIMTRMMFSESDPASQELLKFLARHSGITLTERQAVE